MNQDNRISLFLWAVGLIACGILLLLLNFDALAAYEPLAQYLLAGVLALVGASFFVAYFTQVTGWWRLIPAWTMLALALMVLASTWEMNRRLTASFLFAGQALAFFHLFIVNRDEHWWAIIPGGFMAALGITVAISSYVQRFETLGALLLVCMGLVFFGLYLLAGHRRHWWALIPGSVLALFGLFVFTYESSVQGTLLLWWPIFLVLFGLILAARAARRPPPEKLMVHSAPGMRRPPPSTIPAEEQLPPLPDDVELPAPGASIASVPERE
jgi:hypothetical protein